MLPTHPILNRSNQTRRQRRKPAIPAHPILNRSHLTRRKHSRPAFPTHPILNRSNQTRRQRRKPAIPTHPILNRYQMTRRTETRSRSCAAMKTSCLTPPLAPMARASSRRHRTTTARIWDVASAKEIAVLRGHQQRVERAEFSPDGKRIVTSSSQDDTARSGLNAAEKKRNVLPRKTTT